MKLKQLKNSHAKIFFLAVIDKKQIKGLEPLTLTLARLHSTN